MDSTDKNIKSTCPQCGVSLASDAPDAMCPRCLLAFSLETNTLESEESFPRPLPDIESLREQFPQLEILDCLGRGGMGVVYKARQKALNRDVALKLLAPERADSPGFAERFQKEAQALAALNHPNIITIHDFGKAGEFFFLLMEFVDGVNLRQAMAGRRFTPKQALAMVPPVCEALQFAHERGVVHRDIKPENLLLDTEGKIKVADFGVAKILGSETREDTRIADAEKGSIPVGTPRYMAPEQKDDPTHADHRVDIYALGVVLYELLTGEAPKKDIAPPSSQVQMDVRIDEIVLRALETKPEMRFATASDFKTQVEVITSEKVNARGASNPTATDDLEIRKTTTNQANRSGPLSWVALVLAVISVALGAIASEVTRQPALMMVFISLSLIFAVIGFWLGMLSRRAFIGLLSVFVVLGGLLNFAASMILVDSLGQPQSLVDILEDFVDKRLNPPTAGRRVTSPEALTGPFVANLGNGAFMGLVALKRASNNPFEEGKDWFWNPDGSDIRGESDWSFGPSLAMSPEPEPDSKARGIVIRVRNGVSDEATVIHSIELDRRRSGSAGLFAVTDKAESGDNWYGYLQWYPREEKAADLRFVVSTGPYQSPRNSQGSTPFGEFAITEVVSNTKMVHLRHNLTDCDHRLVAFYGRGNQERKVFGNTTSAQPVEDAFTTELWNFPTVPADEKISVRLEYRPISWISFRNVSLEPGLETEVSIDYSRFKPRN